MASAGYPSPRRSTPGSAMAHATHVTAALISGFLASAGRSPRRQGHCDGGDASATRHLRATSGRRGTATARAFERLLGLVAQPLAGTAPGFTRPTGSRTTSATCRAALRRGRDAARARRSRPGQQRSRGRELSRRRTARRARGERGASMVEFTLDPAVARPGRVRRHRVRQDVQRLPGVASGHA